MTSPRNLLISALVIVAGVALVASALTFAVTSFADAFGGGSSNPAPMAGMGHEMSQMPGMQAGAAAAQQPAATATVDHVEVKMVNMAFQPANLQVKAGTTVTWVNEDSAPHTATARDHSWDSGIFNQGQSWSYTFDTPGAYDYFCVVHPYMTGKVTVTP